MAKSGQATADVLLLVPDLFTPSGGMARHGQLVAHALRSLGLRVDIVSLHDVGGAGVRGCGGSRLRFMYEMVRAAIARPGLVIVEHPRFSDVGLAAAWLSKARLVVFGHGIDIWNRLPWTATGALRRADRVLCVSRYTAERAQERQGLRPDRVAVLHSCVDARSLVVGHSDLASRLSLLTVSRISRSEPYKGHMAVLDALPALLQAYPGLRYDIVGDGDGRSDLERVVAERGLQASVCFHGFIPEDELDRLYAEAGVFVLPSTGEGFGLVFLEAMARGLAVVAARASAVPEIVIDGETGYLVDPARPGELERAVRTLLADEDLRRTMGEAGRARVRSTFNCDVFRHRLAEHLCALGVRVAG